MFPERLGHRLIPAVLKTLGEQEARGDQLVYLDFKRLLFYSDCCGTPQRITSSAPTAAQTLNTCWQESLEFGEFADR